MTPEEVDAIDNGVKGSLCALCATVRGSHWDTFLCSDCDVHVHQFNGFDEEPMAEHLLMNMGITKGCKNFGTIDFTDQAADDGVTDRTGQHLALIYALQERSEPRQRMAWARYCALYMPHTVDLFVHACREARTLASFDGFVFLFSQMTLEPFWTRFLLSDDPRAASANRLALILSQQIILHAPRWDRLLNHVSQGRVALSVIGKGCAALANVLGVQVDKPAAVPLPENLRAEAAAIVNRWRRKWGEDNAIVSPGVRMASRILQRDGDRKINVINGARLARDAYEFYGKVPEAKDGYQYQRTCAKEGCFQTEKLYQCARCEVVLYCCRRHQADDWRAQPLPHRQVCYRPYF